MQMLMSQLMSVLMFTFSLRMQLLKSQERGFRGVGTFSMELPLLLLQPVLEANPSLPQLAVHDPRSGPGQMNEKVHAIDARARIVLDPQVDVFCDTKTEAAILCEILLSEFVFLDVQASLQNILCFLSAHGDMASNLFVAADAERSDRQPCL